MRHLIRPIEVSADTQVSSVWAIPDGYEATSGSAVILAHGAGNDMNHPFICYFHNAFAEGGFLSVKFNFSYMEQGRKAPDRMPLLEATWRAVIAAVKADSDLAPRRLFFAGKSMGGRVASHLVAQGVACDGLIFLGYPLHPAKRPEKKRAEHWGGINCPLLFLQGSRDGLCDLPILRLELNRLSSPRVLHVVEGGDHSFKVPRSTGRSTGQAWAEAAGVAVDWIRGADFR